MKLFPQRVTSANIATLRHRTRPLLAAITTLALPATSLALGLGRPIGEPVLGESLQLAVPLTGTIDRPLDNDCVTIRRPPDSIDADYFPRDLVARVDRKGSESRLLLTTRSGLHHPLVEFRISITCGYNLSHDYLLMVSPRERAQPIAAATAPVSTATVTGVATTRPRSAQETPVIVAPTTGSSASNLPDGVPGKNFTLNGDMTLEQVARLHFPGPLRQERFMRWVIEANPQLFAGVANLRQHRLARGQQLLIPDGIPPRRPGDYQRGVSPLGEPMAQSAADAPARKPRPAPVAEPAAQTGKVAVDGGKDRLVVGSGGGTARDVKETVALVDRLTGMMQQQLSTQTANDEKIQQLEAAVAELNQLVAKMESEAKQREAAVRSELQAAKQAREDETERGWWQLLLAVVAGGVVSVGALKLFGLMADRRRDGSADELGFATREEPKRDAATDLEPGPLTEMGWDEEPQGAARPSAAAAVIVKPATAAPTSETKAAPAAAPTRVAPPSPPAMEKRLSSASAHVPIDFEPPGFDKAEQLFKAAPEPAKAAAPPVSQEPSDPATAAIELANIMTSMGLAESAAQTLVEHIRGNPKQSLQHWLKLLELHRLVGNRTEFERSANEMREHFNVQADEWTQEIGITGRGSLETYSHIRSQLVSLWRQPECLPFLQTLLADNREGTRVGFPLPVAEEILLLIAILSSSA